MPRSKCLYILAAVLLAPACGPGKDPSTGSGSDDGATAGPAGSTGPAATTSDTTVNPSAPTDAHPPGTSDVTTTASTASTDDPATTPLTEVDATTDDCGPCDNPEHVCCGGQCIDPRNDPFNCGSCGTRCAEPTPFCAGEACMPTPCETQCQGDETCCGGACCGGGQICCHIDGPVQSGPTCVEPSASGTCPAGCAPLCMCAAPNTPIATPDGERPIADLRVGDLVYSVDGAQIVAVPVARVRRVPVHDHQVVRAVLADGSLFEITGAHPLGDGRTFNDLRVGEPLGDRRIVEVSLAPYPYAATHDILPASDSGTYFVHGALVGSTLRSERAPAHGGVEH